MHLFAGFCCLSMLAGAAAPESIVIDGRFDDWEGVPVAVTDPADAPDAPADLRSLRVAHDHHFVHFLIDFGRVLNVQHARGSIRLLLDADGDPRSGEEHHGLPGVDVIITLTPPSFRDPSQPGMGIACASTTYDPPLGDARRPALSPYDVGFTFGPTYASQIVEFRLQRGAQLPQTPPFLTGEHFGGKVVLTDFAGAVLDEMPAFVHALPAASPEPAVQTKDPLARSGRNTIRVVSWNVQFGSIVRAQDRARRMISAIEPDIILFQELTHENTPPQIESILNAATAEPWTVIIGEGGGDLRSAVAARGRVQASPISTIAFPGRVDWHLRTASAILAAGPRRVLLMSTHLKCCGRMGDESDLTRMVECHEINDALEEYLREERVDALIVAGDLNLVGSYAPLEILAEDIDVDGSSLAVAEPMQLDGRSNATWHDADQPFVEGRLDYVLYSDSSLEAVRSFVLDTRDIDERWLGLHGLEADDALTVSDHFPVVVDFSFR